MLCFIVVAFLYSCQHYLIYCGLIIFFIGSTQQNPIFIYSSPILQKNLSWMKRGDAEIILYMSMISSLLIRKVG